MPKIVTKINSLIFGHYKTTLKSYKSATFHMNLDDGDIMTDKTMTTIVHVHRQLDRHVRRSGEWAVEVENA